MTDRPPTPSPLGRFFERQDVVILDGGLATALEARGHRLDTDLWSARLLIDAPEEVAAIHRSFLEAGADCVITASYQASHAGFARMGLDDGETDELLIRSVTLARDAVDEFWAEGDGRGERLRPIVAASVGPYGAYLADGSEYDGRYGVGDAELRDFHRRRFRVLAASDADLLACETIPSLQETKVLLDLFSQTPEARGWITFSCRDARHLSDGTPIEEAVDLCAGVEGVAAVGVNCTAPGFVGELVGRIGSRTERPIVVYPNSGEGWDARRKEWTGDETAGDWAGMARAWRASGARCLGGCCRIGPERIAELRRALLGPPTGA